VNKTKFIFYFVALFYLVNMISGSLRLARFDTPSNYTSYLYFLSLIICGVIYRKHLKIDYVETYVILLTIYGVYVGIFNENDPFNIFKGCVATLPAIGLYRIGVNYSKLTTERYIYSLFAIPEIIALFSLIVAKYLFLKGVYLSFGLTYLNTFWLIKYENSKKLRILLLNFMSGRRGNILSLILSWLPKKILAIIFCTLLIILPTMIASLDFDVINAYTSNRYYEITANINEVNNSILPSIIGHGFGHEFATGEDNTQTTLHMSYLSMYAKFGFVSLFFIPLLGIALFRRKGPLKTSSLLIFGLLVSAFIDNFFFNPAIWIFLGMRKNTNAK